MKTKFQNIVTRNKARFAAGASAIAASVPSFGLENDAYLAIFSASMVEWKADITAVLSEIWPLALIVLGSFLLLKLVKRGGNKVT